MKSIFTKNKSTGKEIKLLALFFLTLSLSSCYSWFSGSISMDSDSLYVTLGDLITEEVEITQLSAPEQVFASQGMYAGKIVIRWTESDYATSYRIERAQVSAASDSIPSEEEFSVLEEYVYSTVYVDTILKSPSNTDEEYSYRYYYRISAENIGKGYTSSEYTDPSADGQEGNGWLLACPSNVQADKGKSTDTIKITWDEVETASSYVIYRGENEDGTGMEEIGETSNTYFENSISEKQQGVEYYYKVCANHSSGNSSVFSALAMGYSLIEGAPSSPETVEVTDGTKALTTRNLQVKWSSVSAATGITITYNLYRSSSADSSYSKIKSSIPQATLSYTDTSDKTPGIYYYYYIQTIATDSDGNQQKSGFSDSGPESDNPAVGFILSPPDSLYAEDSDTENQIYLKWTPAIGYTQNTYTYKVYTCSSQYGTYTNTGITVSDTQTDSDGYIYTEIEKCNYYKVSTVNENNLESVLSSCAAPDPSAPVNVYATKNEKFSVNFVMNENTNLYPVKITWDAPEGETPAGYNIYRSTNGTSSFRKLNSEVVTDFEYYDSYDSASAGNYYYYKVISLNSLGSGSKGNDPSTDTEKASWGYGAISLDQWFREYNKTIMHSQSKLTLMHKSSDMDKLGSETIYGDISGSLSYTAAIAGLGAEITMPYKNYADFYIMDTEEYGVYFNVTGNTDTSTNMSANGSMSGTVNVTGMYPGYAVYDNLKIVSGAAGGGYYLVQTYDLNGNVILEEGQVSYLVGNEPTGY